jgi:hypothetical protein
MKDCTNGELDKIRKFAKETGQIDQLNRTLSNLARWEQGEDGNKHPDVETELYTDFAPMSLYFVRKRNGEFAGNGGVIYHGSHDRGGDGGAPTFSVSLEPTQGWSIHT